MDFVRLSKHEFTSNNRKSDYVVKPDFLYAGVKDIVTRGGGFYAYWSNGRWSTSLDDMIIEIDSKTRDEVKAVQEKEPDKKIVGLYMNADDSGLMKKFYDYTKRVPSKDYIKFNSKIMFSNATPKREDYVTTQLNYTPKDSPTPNFDKLMTTLYDKDNLDKILWFMGAVLTNSMKDIQKFMYLYGAKGTGKGTVIDIFKDLFQGYYAEISLATLASDSDFATSQVQEVPLLVDSDSDLSRIKSDTNLLKLTAHEPVTVNKKYQSAYDLTFDGLLITASNQRYQVRNVDSGINRRAVVVEPSNNTMPFTEYKKARSQIKFELPGIAFKAMEHFQNEGLSRYETESDVDMMMATDHIFAFVRENWELLGDPCTLKHAGELYRVYLEDIGFDTRGYKRKIGNELQRYYKHFDNQCRVDGIKTRNVFHGFKDKLVFPEGLPKKVEMPELELDGKESAFDKLAAKYPAQYANSKGTPAKAWKDVTTTLDDLDTTELHYVLVPENHIVVDFDLRDAEGNKNLKMNLQRASEFPETYAEVSQGGSGVHLHYLYQGNPNDLSSVYEDGIEVKVYSGKSSLRRRLTKFNSKDVADLPEGILPLKKEDAKMYDDVAQMVWTEKKMRTAIKKNLRKEYHPATKPSIDFIKHIFDEAEKSGVDYDLRDMRQDILVFAMRSTNNRDYCVKVVNSIKYSSAESHEDLKPAPLKQQFYNDEDLVFFDIEVFSNLLIVCFKQYGKEVTTWFNPTSAQIEELFKYPLVGFNNRRYDNHILYARLLGEDNLSLFHQSQQIINGERNAGMYNGAYDIAYADIYDYNSKKQSLKKWEVEMGIMHDESEFDWEKPLPKEDWDREAEYCRHDTEATEELFKYTYSDYKARKILATLTGLPVSHTTQQQAAAFLFGDDPRPQDKFVYTDLSKLFPGYKYEFGKSEYRGENPGEGGYVYSEPGIYENVAEIDVASMHPSSIIELNYFGPYTQRFADLKQARVLVKHKDFDAASKMFNGALKPYLSDEDSKDLAYSLKIIINIVYGLTSAKFENKFRQKQNVDNIVAKRGALFMINLKHEVQDKGWKVIHIKTDSIKIPDITQEKIDFVVAYGKKYGYNFEVEHVFDKLALINRAVLIGHVENNKAWGHEANTWEAVGAQFAEPYVFKRLFSKEKIEETDFAVTKSAKIPIYLGNQFIGKVAQVYASLTGEEMFRVDGEKKAFVTGTKGYKWKLFSEYSGHEDVDMNYYDGLAKDAIKAIDNVGFAYYFFDDLPKEYEDVVSPF